MWKVGTSQEDLDESAIIVLVGKYTSFADSYISVIKSLEHTAKAYWRKLKPHLVKSSALQWSNDPQPHVYQRAWKMDCNADGVVIPAGFGNRDAGHDYCDEVGEGERGYLEGVSICRLRLLSMLMMSATS